MRKAQRLLSLLFWSLWWRTLQWKKRASPGSSSTWTRGSTCIARDNDEKCFRDTHQLHNLQIIAMICYIELQHQCFIPNLLDSSLQGVITASIEVVLCTFLICSTLSMSAPSCSPTVLWLILPTRCEPFKTCCGELPA